MPSAPLSSPNLERLQALMGAGHAEEALRLIEAMAPAELDHPLPLAVLGAARRREGRFDQAIALLRRRAQLTPDRPEAWTDLGACLMASGRSEAARIVYDAALKAAPGWPDALMGLAEQALEAGDYAAAASRADALPANPALDPMRWWLKARIAMGVRDFARAKVLAEQAIRRPDLDSRQRADMLLLLGLALEGLGDDAGAFAAARDGKAMQRRLYAERAAAREAEPAKLNRLADWFNAADPVPWQASPTVGLTGEEAAEHVFLVGFPRSGTTLLEQVLAGHPDVVALEEAATLSDAYAQFLTSPEGLERLEHLSDDEATTWRARYWSAVRGFGAEPAGRTFIDKAPAGTLYLPLVAKLFPTAKVLFALRDPRDVVLSCLRNNFQLNAMTYAFTDLGEAAACYDACMRMAAVYRRVLPLDLHDVRHEALVRDFDGELSKIAGFLGLDVTPSMADVAATARRRTVRTPSAAQVREGLNAKGLGRWRAYAADLAPVLPMLTPWVERIGYDAG